MIRRKKVSVEAYNCLGIILLFMFLYLLVSLAAAVLLGRKGARFGLGVSVALILSTILPEIAGWRGELPEARTVSAYQTGIIHISAVFLVAVLCVVNDFHGCGRYGGRGDQHWYGVARRIDTDSWLVGYGTMGFAHLLSLYSLRARFSSFGAARRVEK